jgi:phosphoserine phosphatase RsbU/P
MTTMQGIDPPGLDVRRLRAMEIWGGNDACADHVVVPGFDAHIYSRPHGDAPGGGDLHFVSTCAAGNIVRFTVADVSGHGREVSEAALELRGLMRRYINTPNPTRFTRQLNRRFTRMAGQGRFATALVTTYFAPTDHLIVCNAGHPRPLLYRAGAGRWGFFDQSSDRTIAATEARRTGISNLPLGVVHPTSYPQFATLLDPGDILIAYTDAVTEATDGQGRELGEKGLINIVSGLDPADPSRLGPSILDGVLSHRDGRPLDDDATLLVLHHNAANPPALAIGDRLRVLGRLLGLGG